MKKRRIDLYFIQTILFSLIAAGITFGYFIWKGNGFFFVVDDFNEQQLPFATAVWNMIHSGDIGEWSWNIDLGSSFINTFSFYTLGSPFIWLSLLAPRGVFPYLAGFLYILKYVTAAATAYLYLRMFISKREWGVIGALLYAFSGFQTTNLEFFHFHDVTAFFPLLLLGLEMAMKDRQYRPLFVFAIFINCLVNYFFFIGEVLFLVIYYLLRYSDLGARPLFSGILSCTLCGILGVGMAAILFYPSILYVLGNTRAQNRLYLNSLAYDSAGLLHIIKGFLFPGESMRALSALRQQNWDSTSAYIPFFGLSFVIAYVKGNQKNWLCRLLWILGFIALSPLFESLFLLFSQAYQRWWYMFVLVMVLATVIVLDNEENYPVVKSSLLYAGILTLFYLTVRFCKWNAWGDSIVYNVKRFLLLFMIALAGPLVFVLLKKMDRISYKSVLALTMCGCIVTTGLTLHFYRMDNADIEAYRQRFEAGLQLKTLDDQYRYNSTDNTLIINGAASGIGVFCTTVENASRKFDSLFGHQSSNATNVKWDVPGLSELLAGKYEISFDPGDRDVLDYVAARNTTFYITERNACPIGFAVDYVLTEEEFLELPQEQKALTLMQAAIVDKSEFDSLNEAAAHMDSRYSQEESLDALVNKTLDERVFDFRRDSHGFRCTTAYDKNRLVYFTIPWSDGWEAAIDGEYAKVLKSGGMMALNVPAGHHTVEFTYHTPGFRQGIILTLISFGIFTGFCIIQYNMQKKKPGRCKRRST